MHRPLSVFISYALEDQALMLEFDKHLAALKRSDQIVVWEEGLIIAGDNRKETIQAKLNTADLIICLLSSDYVSMESVWESELIQVYEREKRGECCIIPILLRPCEYYFFGKEVLPKRNNQVYPVVSPQWNNRDEALLTVVKEINKVIKSISGETISEENDDAYADEQELKKRTQEPRVKNKIQDSEVTVGRDLNIGDKKRDTIFAKNVYINNNPNDSTPSSSQLSVEAPFSKFTIETVWGSLPLRRGVPKREVLELDRLQEFSERLMLDFNKKANEDQNLFYFINCCKTQCPENIARRFIHFCDDIFIEYARVADDFDDVYIYDLDIKRDRFLTWDNFWVEFKSRLPSEWGNTIGQPHALREEEFIAFSTTLPENLRRIKRYPVLCEVKANRWASSNEVENHLLYIIEQFSRLPKGTHKFVFIFLIELSDLHRCYCEEEHFISKRYRQIQALQTRNFTYEINPHIFMIELLEHIALVDLKNWLHVLIDTNTRTLDDCIDLLLRALLESMREEEHSLYQEHQCFRMDRLAIMQRYAYNYVK